MNNAAFSAHVARIWKRLFLLAIISASCRWAEAALDLGDPAPAFTARAAVAGQITEFSLRQALEEGPVVLYFFPASFSEQCSIEAHDFAEATDNFRALGATVVGVSRDDIETQRRFSATACRGKFAVVADPDQSIMRAYDAVLTLRPEYANRVTYIITPDQRVAHQYTSLNSGKHVQKTLAALRRWRAEQKSTRP